MIEIHCRTAGRLLQEAEASVSSDVRRELLEEAEENHARCPGGTQCCCQHVLAFGTVRSERLTHVSTV